MVTAEQIMTKRFLRISTEHTLREALALLLYGERKKAETAAIVVIDTLGDFAGILTPDCVVKGLSNSDATPLDSPETLALRIEKNFPVTIDTVMKKRIPIVSKETKLANLIALSASGKHECLPVSEEGRIEGLVYVSDIFKAAAGLALTSEDEGIALE